MSDSRPILFFRIHFADPDMAPLDLDAEDANEAREKAKKRRVGVITKIKRIRENTNG